MTLVEYALLLRRHRLVVLAALVLGLGAAVAYLVVATPLYTASSRVYISANTGGAAVSELNQGSAFTLQSASTLAGVAASPIVLERAITVLGTDETVDELAARVEVTVPEATTLLDVAVVDDDPVRAAATADAIASAFEEVLEHELATSQGDGTPALSARTIAPASVPEGPSEPRPFVVLGVGVLAGLGLGVALAVLRSVLDTRVRGSYDAEAVTGLPWLGAVLRHPRAATRPLVVHADPHGPETESIRRIRASLDYVLVRSERTALMVTSAGPSEGKSYTAANLAATVAETGKSVVLVDADLRRPRVDHYFGVEGGAGLSDLLVGRAELADVLQPWGDTGLTVLASGAVPPNPAELLGTPAMEAVLADLQERFDLVVLDAPPTLLVADTAVMSKHADVLLVVADGRVRRAEVTGAVRSLHAVGARLVGVVSTMVRSRDAEVGSYGTYGNVRPSDLAQADVVREERS